MVRARLALGNPFFQSPLSPSFLSPKADRPFPPGCLPLVPSLLIFLFSALHFPPSQRLEASGQEKACIHHAPLPLLPSRHCAKEPLRKDLPPPLPSLQLSCSEQRKKLTLPIPHRVCSRASCLAFWGVSQGLERNKPPPASSPHLAAPNYNSSLFMGSRGVCRDPDRLARPCAGRCSAYTHEQDSALAEADTDK